MRVFVFVLLSFALHVAQAQTTSVENKGMGSNSSSTGIKGFKPQNVEITKDSNFDIGKIGGLGRIETADKFGKIWEVFRKSYALNSDGVFVESYGANTPNNAVTQNEFLYFVAENRPSLALTSTEKCARCSGRGRRTALFNGNAQGAESQIASVTCEDCQGLGKINLTETIKLSFSGKLPVRPSKEERQALAPKPTQVESEPTITTKGSQLLKNIDPHDERFIIFNETKAKAEAGDLDAEYKYAKYFEGKYPVNKDLKTCETMMHVLADKGYTQAYHELAQIHLRRAFTYTSAKTKIDSEELAECIKWKLIYGGPFIINQEVSESTEAEGKRRADTYLSLHPKKSGSASEQVK
jgi:hypothetical protein